MYTVNGVHPDKGLNEWYVTTGDEIVWHYIDDYKVEQADMKDDSGNYATGGNASTWNKWLEAVDETPGAKENAIKVINQIKQIDETIELTDECEAKITTARKAYDALTREEKGYVNNYDVLLKAEEQLSALKKEKADKEAAETEEVKKETAGSVRRNFDHAFGWEGSRYDSSLTLKEIAKIVRGYVKKKYPTCPATSASSVRAPVCPTIE